MLNSARIALSGQPGVHSAIALLGQKTDLYNKAVQLGLLLLH